MADEAGYLWQRQWAQLEALLRDSGMRPSSFERIENLTRRTFFGTTVLPATQQWAKLQHRAQSDVWFHMQHRDATYDSDGDEVDDEGWVLLASPSTDDRPHAKPMDALYVDDFDEVLDVAQNWALLAADELAARSVPEQARMRAQAEWRDRMDDDGPLQISRVSSFVEHELSDLIAESLRQGGVENEAAIEVGSDVVKRRSEELIVAAGDREPKEFPALITNAIRDEILKRFAGSVVDVAIGFLQARLGEIFPG